MTAGVNASALVFSNPVSLDPIPARHGMISRQRQNPGIRISRDQGKTWSDAVSLEGGSSAYNDLAVAPDGTICASINTARSHPTTP